jgi:murein DD-endopeptidase MepM/ murein hydrolase activator NlpD
MCKITKILLISILVCAITFVSYAADLNELQEQKSDIQNQLDESNSELEDVNNELTQNLQQIQKLDSSIEEAEETLSDLNSKISGIEQDIESIEQELTKVTDKYNTQKELLDARLVAMYETESTNYLDVVLGSKSISDFISTYYLIAEITAYDMDLLETVDNERNEIQEKSAIVNKQKEILEQARSTAQRTQITLSNTKLLRENYISKLSEEEQQIQTKIDEYNNQIKEIETEIKSLALIQSFGESYSGGPMAWPIYGHYTITSNYGMRVHPITGVYKLHTGVDISATIGTDFTAIANGIVVKAEYNTAYGNMVIIDHGGGVQTLYAHGSEIVVNVGDEVSCGDVVLKVGSTGYSTGPHAHFEVRINGETVNPLDYVSIPENENN